MPAGFWLLPVSPRKGWPPKNKTKWHRSSRKPTPTYSNTLERYQIRCIFQVDCISPFSRGWLDMNHPITKLCNLEVPDKTQFGCCQAMWRFKVMKKIESKVAMFHSLLALLGWFLPHESWVLHSSMVSSFRSIKVIPIRNGIATNWLCDCITWSPWGTKRHKDRSASPKNPDHWSGWMCKAHLNGFTDAIFDDGVDPKHQLPQVCWKCFVLRRYGMGFWGTYRNCETDVDYATELVTENSNLWPSKPFFNFMFTPENWRKCTPFFCAYFSCGWPNRHRRTLMHQPISLNRSWGSTQQVLHEPRRGQYWESAVEGGRKTGNPLENVEYFNTHINRKDVMPYG